MIRLSEPFMWGNEKKYIDKAIAKNEIAIGSYLHEFENEIKKYTSAKGCALCSSGTAGIHLALKALGVTDLDEVLTPTLTFIATINAIKYLNAKPIFFDCDKYSNVEVSHLKRFILNNTTFKSGFSYNKKTNQRVSALIIVHVWGNSCDFHELAELCRERNIKIVEDASESLGSFVNNLHTGLIGDAGVISFNGNKIITTGGGGCIISNNLELIDKANYYLSQSKDDPINFVHNELGFNYRLSNISAAMGYAQILNLEAILEKKKFINTNYRALIRDEKKYFLREVPDHGSQNHWLNLVTFINPVNIENLIYKMSQEKIEVRPIWHLCHMQPFLENEKVPYKISNASKIRSSSLCLPSSVILDLDELSKVISMISKYA
jgi:perosamine synthetase